MQERARHITRSQLDTKNSDGPSGKRGECKGKLAGLCTCDPFIEHSRNDAATEMEAGIRRGRRGAAIRGAGGCGEGTALHRDHAGSHKGHRCETVAWNSAHAGGTWTSPGCARTSHAADAVCARSQCGALGTPRTSTLQLPVKLYLLQNKHCFPFRRPAKPHFPDPASRSPLSGQLLFGATQVPAGHGRPENRARWAGVLASGLRNPPRPRSFLGQGEEQDPWGRSLGDGHCSPSPPHPPAVFPCTGLVGQGFGFYSVTMESADGC